MSNIESRLKKVVSEQLNVPIADVVPDASFENNLGADSLDTVELIMAIEEEFEIEVPDHDAEKITRVRDLLDYLNAHVKAEA